MSFCTLPQPLRDLILSYWSPTKDLVLIIKDSMVHRLLHLQLKEIEMESVGNERAWSVVYKLLDHMRAKRNLDINKFIVVEELLEKFDNELNKI